MLTRRAMAAGLLSAVPAGALAAMGAPKAARARRAILSVVAAMEAAWNRGDFRGYMAGFENPGVTFVSGGHIQKAGRQRSTIMSAITAARPSGVAGFTSMT